MLNFLTIKLFISVFVIPLLTTRNKDVSFFDYIFVNNTGIEKGEGSAEASQNQNYYPSRVSTSLFLVTPHPRCLINFLTTS